METVRFDELDLCQEILRGVKEMGFEEASPIQAQAIPVAMQGYDVIGQDRQQKRSESLPSICTV